MHNKKVRILAINPGSTSTKVAVYEDDVPVLERSERHTRAQLDACGDIASQRSFRYALILRILEEEDLPLNSIDAVVARGGLIKPLDSGTYLINEAMLSDLTEATATVHASALGGLIGHEFGQTLGVPAYVVDPVVVDEMNPEARLTGFPGIERISAFHALNQKAVARRSAADIGLPYDNLRLIVAHMGGGITVGAHRYGRVIDVNDGMAGEGPFSPERTGGVPILPLIERCFSGAYSREDLRDIITKTGGMTAYLSTNDLQKCERLIKEGDEFATLVLESMAYQISKEIGRMYAVLEGRVDAILLTGGLAHSTRFTGSIKNRVGLLAPVRVYPGEDEMKALVAGALRVLRGEEPALDY